MKFGVGPEGGIHRHRFGGNFREGEVARGGGHHDGIDDCQVPSAMRWSSARR